jgi:hypothetical protein
VVDNDPERSAEQLVSNLARRKVLPVRYISERRAGISHARNAGVAASSGRYMPSLTMTRLRVRNGCRAACRRRRTMLPISSWDLCGHATLLA